MRIKYKLFPYPVLCEEIDDYKNNKFDVEPIVEKDINRIIIKFNVAIEDKKIKDMIEIGQVEIVYHIECPKTLFRRIYKSNSLENEVYIDNKELNGSVEICCFIIAKNNIDTYKNLNFNDDYGDNSFSIQKGNILGFYNLPRINIIKDTEDLAKMSSIFSILRSSDTSEEGMSIRIEEDKIKIWLRDNEFFKYKDLVRFAKFQPLIHAMIILPTLIYVFDMIEKDGEDEYESCRWFKALEKTLRNSNIVLNRETIENHNSYKLAQKLLNLPVNRALMTIDEEEE